MLYISDVSIYIYIYNKMSLYINCLWKSLQNAHIYLKYEKLAYPFRHPYSAFGAWFMEADLLK